MSGRQRKPVSGLLYELLIAAPSAVVFCFCVALLGMYGWFWYVTAAVTIITFAWIFSDPGKVWYVRKEESDE